MESRIELISDVFINSNELIGQNNGKLEISEDTPLLPIAEKKEPKLSQRIPVVATSKEFLGIF